MRTAVAVLMVLTVMAIVGCGGEQTPAAAPEQAAPAAAPAAPAAPVAPAAVDTAAAATPAATQYTCTMHPEVVTDAPGMCPKCNMALVPKQ